MRNTGRHAATRVLRSIASPIALLVAALIAGCQQAPITGRNQLILLPAGQEVALGAEAYQKILSESRISRDPKLNRRVRTVGQRIAAAADDPGFDWEFVVIEDETPNAFALPGGKVAVHTGLFRVARGDAQLAAVMAHEVAHAIARHGGERISHQIVIQTGIQVAASASETAAQYADLLAQTATLGIILPYNRTQESEADHIGLLYMAEAGYDPRQAIELWRNFSAAGGERPPEFLSTHPSPGTRIARLNQLMPKALAVFEVNKGRYQ